MLLAELDGKIAVEEAFVVFGIGLDFACDGGGGDVCNLEIAAGGDGGVGLVGQSVVESNAAGAAQGVCASHFWEDKNDGFAGQVKVEVVAHVARGCFSVQSEAVFGAIKGVFFGFSSQNGVGGVHKFARCGLI